MRFELVLRASSTRLASQPTCLATSCCTRLADRRGRLAAAVEQRLDRRLGLGAAHGARLDQLLHRAFGLLAGHLAELDTRLEQLLQGVLGHPAMLTGDADRRPACRRPRRGRERRSRPGPDRVAGPGHPCPHEGERAAERDTELAVGAGPVADDEQPLGAAARRPSPARPSAIGAYGLPATTGWRPAAVTTAARIAPPPGIGPSGVGIRGVVVGGDRAGRRRAPPSTRCASGRSRT